jgi:RimJ/RimL family protein N-acetyltransferase
LHPGGSQTVYGTFGDASGTVTAMNAFPSPVIHSARLELREYRPDDAGLVRAVLADGEAAALPPGAPAESASVPAWLDDGARRPRGEVTALHLMLLDTATGQIVGSIGLFHADWQVRSAEIGYGVRGDRRGQGFATEALEAVTRWALTDGGFQRAWLTANTDNLASVRVAEKAGFHREGTLRRAGLEDDGLHDLAVFSLLDADR